MPNFVTLADVMRQRQAQPASSDDWSDRITSQARQTPEPQTYPDSPWMPRVPDYGARSRVFNPDAVLARQLRPPVYQSEDAWEGAYDVPAPAPRPDLPYSHYDDASLRLRMSARLLADPWARINPFPLARDMLLNWWRSNPEQRPVPQQETPPVYDDDIFMWWRK